MGQDGIEVVETLEHGLRVWTALGVVEGGELGSWVRGSAVGVVVAVVVVVVGVGVGEHGGLLFWV